MVDLSTVNTFPYIRSISATTNATEVKLPLRARKITIASKTGVVVFAYDGTDNATPSAHHLFVPNYGMVQQTLGRGKDRPTSVFVAMDTTPGTVKISFEDE